MVHGKKRTPYWIDRRLIGLAGPDYDAIISFGLPIDPEDSQYGNPGLYAGMRRHRWKGLGQRSNESLGPCSAPSMSDSENRTNAGLTAEWMWMSR